ncbi:Retrovirus-related Pol polyprotein from type-2 retrotransposable element R2DM [Diplonema papillatum]|nr:Retrovirus-related Pol polyprotein from type-2 retrotransposable element R2DM [Diplonema papillatum]
MRRNATYGDELTLRAASRVLRCDIWVLNATSRETLRGCRQPAPTATIILTYRPEHYDAMLLPLPSQRLLEVTTGDSVPLARLALVNAGPVAGTAAPTHRPPTGVPVAAQTRQQDTRPRAPGSRRPCDKLADLRSNLTVATFNVTSYRRHYLDVHGLDADLVALQEVRLDEASAKASAALVRQELGARLYVGKPLPLKRMGNGGLQAPPGGVAFHVRDRSTKADGGTRIDMVFVNAAVGGHPLDGGAVNAHQQATSKLIRQIEAIERDSADVTGLKAQLVRKQRWDKARAGGKKLMADDAWAEVWGRPSPPVGETMMKMLADLRGSQKKLAHDVKETRINEWRRSMQLAAKVAPGRIFAWVKQADRRQVEYLARADGSVTWDAKEMDELLRGPSAWGGVYERHGRKETPAPKWEAFEKDFRAHIPRANAVELNAITAADLRKTLGTMKKNTAPGAEGWRVRELAALPDEALRRFAELFAVVEKTGKWPESLMRALVSLIPKGEGGSGPMDLRPISVTSAVYRLWAATRLRMLMEWMLAWVPEGMRGAIPKRGADDVMYAIGLRIEHAAECGKPLFGLSVDFMKCFDRLPHEIMFRLMEVMGLDPGVLRAMKAVYGSMQRHFKTARAVGEPFVATNGILQGCPLSVLFLNALIAVWVRAVGALTTPAQAMAYLDDIHAMSESLRGLKAVAEVTTDFANATDGGVNAGKSFFYATNADAPGTLTVQGNKVLRKTSFDVLGAMFTVGKGAPPPSRRIQTRFEAAKNIARRARSLPIPMDQKEGYVAASATAKALYGVSVWQPAGTYMEGLRVATLAGLWTGGNRRCDAVVLNTLCRGHRLDPRVAAIHRRVNTFSQQMVKQSHLAPLVVAIRAARQARRDRPPGAPEAPGRSNSETPSATVR